MATVQGAAMTGTFVDLFAGGGGLSLGLMLAGWNGLFAVEQDSLAFRTLKFNLLEDEGSCPHKYDWPIWLEKSPIEISHFIEKHGEELATLKGKLDLLAGGPPCQGFSLAGRRKSNDPRNRLFKHYVEIVELLQPPFLLLENVKGISVAFRKKAKDGTRNKKTLKPFSERIKKSLRGAGYEVFTRLVRAMEIGVPQFRPRYIMLAIRRDLLKSRPDFDPFHDYEKRRKAFLKAKGLPLKRAITVSQAISDLETKGKKLVDCVDATGCQQIKYSHPKTNYQRLLHGELNGTAPNSLRLANHRDKTKNRFQQIISTCRHGIQLSEKDRKRFGLKKHCTVPLDANQPSHTLTTLPDDLLHYSEPRILTVREYARLQSFPDWYEFKGKYATGGDKRLKECPRYTQTGNAVPPFLAEFIGLLLKDLNRKLRQETA
jgi:DNA (cytosine-5)-methyltransferase 1